MNLTPYPDDFVACLLRADRPAAADLLHRALDAGLEPRALLLDVIQPSMRRVGDLWSRQQASLTQYFVAGRIAEDVTDAIVPLLEREGAGMGRGRVVIGTIAGDYHGLGRKIVSAFLRAVGVQVRDLGLDVAPARFVAAAREEGADIVAVSALMVHAVRQMGELRPMLDEQGARHVRLLVGGAPFNYHKRLYREVGADATARNAGEAVRVVQELLAVRAAP